jgi:lipopolysaccharide/colanic/teichoic acid biosynthesis glycosyltransferase
MHPRVDEGDKRIAWLNDSDPDGPRWGEPPAPEHWFMPWKTAAEFVLALGLLVLAAPCLAVIAAVVRLTSRGPILYKQTRLGKNGRPYTIYKIRTMAQDSESKTGPCWSGPRDPRVTPVGRFLRRTHLDELPQLWNVLRGDMSLIGPRPERPELIPPLEQAIPQYRARLRVRPGVTGLAQVQLPPYRDIEDVRRKVAYDLFYIEYLSPWLDLRIFVCTALHMAGIPYHVLRRLFRLPHVGRVEDLDRGPQANKVELPELQTVSS